MYSKASRKRDITVWKNNLNKEVEQQQDLSLLQELIGKFLFFIEHMLIIMLSSH